jgi:hypothetical protein
LAPYAAALVLIGLLVIAMLWRPFAVVGVIVHPLGIAAAAAFLALFAFLVLVGVGNFRPKLASAINKRMPLLTLASFAAGALVVGLPLQAFASDRLGLEVSWQAGEPASHFLLVVNDDFGNNALPRPDSMTIFEVSGDEVIVTPVLRDWKQSRVKPDQTLALKHFGISDCEPYCELKDLVARLALERPAQVGISVQAELAAEVIAAELNLRQLRVVEVSPGTIERVLEQLAPIEVTVENPIPVGGKWVDERMIEIRYWIPAGEQSLGTEEALWFARARWTSSNEDRVSRQMTLIQAAVSQHGGQAVLSAVLGARGVTTNLKSADLFSIGLSASDVLSPNFRFAPAVGN